MSDQLEEIKKNWNITGRLSSELLKLAPVSASRDMEWLISEVERLRSENEGLKNTVDNYEEFIRPLLGLNKKYTKIECPICYSSRMLHFYGNLYQCEECHYLGYSEKKLNATKQLNQNAK